MLNTQAPIVTEQLPLPIVLMLAVTLGEQACKIKSSMIKLHQLNAELVRDRVTMLEILRGLNDDRIRTSENLSSLAENVARIANVMEQREE